MNSKTQRQCLRKEIKDLKEMTDRTILDAHLKLAEIERLQQGRESSKNFFEALVPLKTSAAGATGSSQCDLTSKYQYQSNNSQMDMQANLLAIPQQNYKEPASSLTKGSIFTFAQSTNTNASSVQFMRHQSQGPMRSEKVYMLTELIERKLEQLAGEKHLVKARFQVIDDEVAKQKGVINDQYDGLVGERDALDAEKERKDTTINELDGEE